MARYTDIDALVTEMEKRNNELLDEYGLDAYVQGYEDAISKVENAPTADVVSREDYDAVIAAQESLQMYIARLEKDLSEAREKIVTLYMEQIKSDELAKTICALYARQEAEDIFGELDKILAFVIDDDVKVSAFDFSKYTEIKRRHI